MRRSLEASHPNALAQNRATTHSTSLAHKDAPRENLYALLSCSTNMSDDIFISYRRVDSQAYAGRLHDRLVQVFWRDQVFIDVDAIEPGVAFAEVLDERLRSCMVVLAIIGNRWIDARDANGSRRLDDPGDLVRVELETALVRNIRVVPVLVDGAEVPMSNSLPAGLAHLVDRQAVRLTHERFAADADALVKSLTKIFTPKREGVGIRSVNTERSGGWSAKWTELPSYSGWSIALAHKTRRGAIHDHVLAATGDGFVLDGKNIADQPSRFNLIWHFKIDGEKFELVR